MKTLRYTYKFKLFHVIMALLAFYIFTDLAVSSIVDNIGLILNGIHFSSFSASVLYLCLSAISVFVLVTWFLTTNSYRVILTQTEISAPSLIHSKNLTTIKLSDINNLEIKEFQAMFSHYRVLNIYYGYNGKLSLNETLFSNKNTFKEFCLELSNCLAIKKNNTDDIDDIFRQMEEDKPRIQHYCFAHIALRQVAFDNPKGIVNYLYSNEAQKLIQSIWQQILDRYSEPTNLSFSSIKLHTCLAHIFPCVIIEMPIPIHCTEAYFIALVLRRLMLSENMEVSYSPELFYYVLEKSHQSNVAVFCEWTENENHLNYGEVSARTLNDFIELVSSKVLESMPDKDHSE